MKKYVSGSYYLSYFSARGVDGSCTGPASMDCATHRVIVRLIYVCFLHVISFFEFIYVYMIS